MSLYEASIPQFTKILASVSHMLDQAEASATERKFDVGVLLEARLAPDQWPLTRQIQAACDTAKLAGSRLAAQDAPKHEDGPATITELRQRIEEVRSYLTSLDKGDFAGAADRRLSPGFLRGATISGHEYLHGFALPNFYFHVTTAYAILRHNGVTLGKQAFIGSLDIQPAAEA